MNTGEEDGWSSVITANRSLPGTYILRCSLCGDTRMRDIFVAPPTQSWQRDVGMEIRGVVIPIDDSQGYMFRAVVFNTAGAVGTLDEQTSLLITILFGRAVDNAILCVGNVISTCLSHANL